VQVTDCNKRNTRMKSDLFTSNHIVDDADCISFLYISLFTKFMFKLKVFGYRFLINYAMYEFVYDVPFSRKPMEFPFQTKISFRVIRKNSYTNKYCQTGGILQHQI
jgi:hypothetical protein